MFRIIIAGGRDFGDYELLKKECDSYIESLEKSPDEIIVISGMAWGADSLGEQYAEERNLKIEGYPANWVRFGKSAGYRRNVAMVEVADAAICFWDGESKGTNHTINLCNKKGIPCKIVKYIK